MDCFGIGTHLVTCQKQPALGGVYKLVEINKFPRVKLSNEVEKSTLPCKKELLRLYDEKGVQIGDLMALTDDKFQVGEEYDVYEVSPNTKEAKITFAKIENIYEVVWDGSQKNVEEIVDVRKRVLGHLHDFNPKVLSVTPEQQYPVYISQNVYTILKNLVTSQ